MVAGKRKEAMLAGETHYFTGIPCKHGHIDKRLVVNGSCMSCIREKNAEIYESYYRPYVQKNKQKIKETMSRYQKNNKGKVNSRTAERYSSRMQRTPKWITKDDRWLMQEAYLLAQLRENTTGVKWQVDHIIPMRGQNVSGLHVPSNLQVITCFENVAKNNSWNWETQNWK
jgi:hypothetical protein